VNKDELPEGFSQKMQDEKQKTRPKYQPPKDDKKQLVPKEAPKEEEKPKAKVCTDALFQTVQTLIVETVGTFYIHKTAIIHTT